MRAEPEGASRLARRIADSLEAAGVPYALGGALALGIWAEPRGTLDVDVTTFLSPEEIDRVLSPLASLGASLDRAAAQSAWRERGMFQTRIDGLRVDVFCPDIALYQTARDRRRRIEFLGAPAWFWSPEDLLLFKMLYFREKDRADILRLLEIQRGRLDAVYVWNWLDQIFDDEEPRTRWLGEKLPRS